ncbi:MAG: transporter [Anaerosolibacter sp.]|jgi:TRAP-type C4-dicarboxylate transport system permease small subunit|uniref:TRAP transporter small permease n=1 Tax=Anaerosolibacter sp. TaxID=1872527 RepID=UPI00260B60C8|nr:TRAP transporter small permease [Anaerosolibacter sp.]MDF2546769.1 transporter [Anaerosolibacter sp.]
MKNRVFTALNKIEDTVLIAMFMAMVGIIFFQVIMRYVFNNSLSWSEELGKFLFVWLSWLGISIGHRRKEHIKITLLVDKLPYKLKKLAEAITELILIVICGITLYYGVIMINIQVNVPYAGIKISTAWGYLSLVLGCGIFIIRAVAFFLEAVKCILKNEVIT